MNIQQRSVYYYRSAELHHFYPDAVRLNRPRSTLSAIERPDRLRSQAVGVSEPLFHTCGAEL